MARKPRFILDICLSLWICEHIIYFSIAVSMWAYHILPTMSTEFIKFLFAINRAQLSRLFVCLWLFLLFPLLSKPNESLTNCVRNTRYADFTLLHVHHNILASFWCLTFTVVLSRCYCTHCTCNSMYCFDAYGDHDGDAKVEINWHNLEQNLKPAVNFGMKWLFFVF